MGTASLQYQISTLTLWLQSKNKIEKSPESTNFRETSQFLLILQQVANLSQQLFFRTGLGGSGRSGFFLLLANGHQLVQTLDQPEDHPIIDRKREISRRMMLAHDVDEEKSVSQEDTSAKP